MNWKASTSLPLIIGHRGASANAPENTLAAFAQALHQGADGVELDVQLSADGQLVVFHDDDVTRMTSGRGKVADLTLAELRQLTMAEDQTIPTLDEVLQRFDRELLYNIEVKDFGWRNRGTETAVAATILAHQLEEQVLVSSFNPLALRRLRAVLPPRIPLALIRGGGWLKYGYWLADGAADHPHYSLVDGAYMTWAKKQGYLVNVWTVDAPEEAQRLMALGVNGIITNKPGFIRQQLTS